MKRKPKRLTPDELVDLLKKYCAEIDPRKKAKLTDKLVEGWYGETLTQIREREAAGEWDLK